MKFEYTIPVPKTKREVYLRYHSDRGFEKGLRKR